jgi:3-oxoacyl-[acyl-carrier protein] reductase
MLTLNQSQTCLISGCSGYIGSAIAKTLISQNWQIWGITRKANTSQLDPKVHWITADLANPNSINEISAKFNQVSLDAIIHCLGFSPDHSMQNLSEEDFQIGLTLNFSVIQKLNQCMIPNLKNNGSILHFGSRVGIVGNFGQIAYAAAKGLLIDYTKNLAAELGAKNITVNMILPGVHPSEILGENRKFIMDNAKKASLLNQLTNIEDVVNAVLYLLKARSVTGQIFAIESRLIE